MANSAAPPPPSPTLPSPLAGGLGRGRGSVGRWESAVDRVFPQHLLGRLDRRDVEIDDHRLLAGTHQNAFQHFVPAGIDFLVWDVGWHIDEIARARLGGELQLFAPSHPRPALD